MEKCRCVHRLFFLLLFLKATHCIPVIWEAYKNSLWLNDTIPQALYHPPIPRLSEPKHSTRYVSTLTPIDSTSLTGVRTRPLALTRNQPSLPYSSIKCHPTSFACSSDLFLLSPCSPSKPFRSPHSRSRSVSRKTRLYQATSPKTCFKLPPPYRLHAQTATTAST